MITVKKTLKRRLKQWHRYHFRFNLKKINRAHLLRIKEIRQRGYANVLLIASALPMWRLQGVYELLKKDSRFKVHVLVHPFYRLPEEEKQKAVEDLKACFDASGVDYILCPTDDNELKALLERLDPDILFYPQNYYGLFRDSLEWKCFKDRLLCYNNYGLSTIAAEWNYNTDYNNVAWRYYHATSLHLQTAKVLTYNKAKNAIVVGEARADLFFAPVGEDPWKRINDGKTRKRVIFAPHFQIQSNSVLNRAAFLWLSDFMIEMAEQYKDTLQFAFKPHPFLKTALYSHPDWGKEKTDAYYEKWATMPNTQLETGTYIDLFKTSDAMIHNCGSFTGEYMFTGKPVLFTSKDWNEIYGSADDFGLKCLELHYKAGTTEEVKHFLDSVVLGDADNLSEERQQFMKDYLIPPHGKTAAENIYEDLVNSLGF